MLSLDLSPVFDRLLGIVWNKGIPLQTTNKDTKPLTGPNTSWAQQGSPPSPGSSHQTGADHCLHRRSPYPGDDRRAPCTLALLCWMNRWFTVSSWRRDL